MRAQGLNSRAKLEFSTSCRTAVRLVDWSVGCPVALDPDRTHTGSGKRPLLALWGWGCFDCDRRLRGIHSSTFSRADRQGSRSNCGSGTSSPSPSGSSSSLGRRTRPGLAPVHSSHSRRKDCFASFSHRRILRSCASCDCRLASPTVRAGGDQGAAAGWDKAPAG